MLFSTAFMAEYLDTSFAQLAIVVFCLNSLLHNTAWNILHRTIVKPNSLLKENTSVEFHNKARQDAKMEFYPYAVIAIIAW